MNYRARFKEHIMTLLSTYILHTIDILTMVLIQLRNSIFTTIRSKQHQSHISIFDIIGLNIQNNIMF